MLLIVDAIKQVAHKPRTDALAAQLFSNAEVAHIVLLHSAAG